jgi:hypothetical protein
MSAKEHKETFWDGEILDILLLFHR